MAQPFDAATDGALSIYYRMVLYLCDIRLVNRHAFLRWSGQIRVDAGASSCGT